MSKVTPCYELETVAKVSTVFIGIETFEGNIISEKLKSGDILVTRQNAEEVIAAERMKLEATAKVGLQLTTQIEALEAYNKRLREALEPFANVAEHDIGGDEDDGDIFWPISNERFSKAGRLRVGDLRRASKALGEAAASPLGEKAG